MNRWMPLTDPKLLRRLGKLGEEANELGAVACRAIIQGIEEVDPSSSKTNRRRLEEEAADVLAQIALTVELLHLDSQFIQARVENKMVQMGQWEALCETQPS